MELKDALLKRRSMRKFTEETVSSENIDELMHAAMSGPSACNRQPWAFYIINDPQAMQVLHKATPFTNIQAPLAIVVCGDLSRALPSGYAEYWIQDCSAATENILLRAVDLGLGGVWCGLHPQKMAKKRVAALLGLSDKLIPLNIIYIGHPAETPEAGDHYQSQCVHYYQTDKAE